MFVVMTRVRLKPNSHEACANLFRETNPDLVAREQDWLGAQMIFDAESNVVTVLAKWRDRQSYVRMSNTLRFQHTMRRFSELFASPPEVTVNSVLVEMAPEAVV